MGLYTRQSEHFISAQMFMASAPWAPTELKLQFAICSKDCSKYLASKCLFKMARSEFPN